MIVAAAAETRISHQVARVTAAPAALIACRARFVTPCKVDS